MRRQNRFDRIYFFGRKIVAAEARALHPAAVMGRFTGPRVLSNGIPKSGTNLLERILSLMPGMRMAPFRTLMDWDRCGARTGRRLRSLKRGQFINAHLPAHRAVMDLVSSLNITSLLMIRDPRDIVVSSYRYICYIDTTHYAHAAVSRLDSDSARLAAVIRGIEGAVAPVDEIWRRYYPWIEDPATLVVRYEDLIGARGGGGAERQMAAIGRIAAHLGLQITRSEITRVADMSYNTKAPTFREGKTGRWRSAFQEHHVSLFKEMTGDLLIRLGYERDQNWKGAH